MHEVGRLNIVKHHNSLEICEVFCKKGVLENFAKFTGKHLYQRLFFLWILQNFQEHLFS